jgi:hypothetical protein
MSWASSWLQRLRKERPYPECWIAAMNYHLTCRLLAYCFRENSFCTIGITLLLELHHSSVAHHILLDTLQDIDTRPRNSKGPSQDRNKQKPASPAVRQSFTPSFLAQMQAPMINTLRAIKYSLPGRATQEGPHLLGTTRCHALHIIWAIGIDLVSHSANATLRGLPARLTGRLTGTVTIVRIRVILAHVGFGFRNTGLNRVGGRGHGVTGLGGISRGDSTVGAGNVAGSPVGGTGLQGIPTVL